MFTLAFGSAFLIWFSTVETVLCTVKGKMRLDMGHPWARPLPHGVGDDITVVKLARDLVSRFEEDGAPFSFVFV